MDGSLFTQDSSQPIALARSFGEDMRAEVVFQASNGAWTYGPHDFDPLCMATKHARS